MDIENTTLTDASSIAVVGCSYGNVPALTACINDAHERGCDGFVFLGDAIGCCGHSNEILDRVTEEFDACIAGNLEQQAVNQASGCGCGFSSESDEAISGRAFRFAQEQLDDAHRRMIATWPDLIRLETRAGAVLLCHGSPERTNEFLYKSEMPEKPWQDWCNRYDVRGLFCAHTGFPWTKRVEEYVLANCGAAGKPDHDGDPAVHYLQFDPDPDFPRMSIRRVTYDVERWVDRLADQGVDDIYRRPLLTGRWTYGLSRVPEPELDERVPGADRQK